MNALVVGVGNPDRGDDGVGAAVVEELRRRSLAGADVVVAASPTRLLDAWEGYQRVVVVDAVRTGRAAGSVTVEHVRDGALPVRSGAAGTHGFGVAEAIELARALDRLPPAMVLVAVEADGFAPGAALSPPVASAVAAAADAVAGALQEGDA